MAQMMKEHSANWKREIDLRTKYAEQIGKQLGIKLGARFYQIDDYISTARKLDRLDGVPFVGDRR